MLFAFVGCSGVGKNTVITKLLKEHEGEYDILQTLTTRKMREYESQGNPYYFVSMEEFKKLMEDGMIYEHEWVHENLYGGSRKVLEEKQKAGKTLLKDIDILGANTLKTKLKDELDVVSLFLYVEDVEILLDRLRGRGETEEEIEKRRKRFDMEMSLSPTADYMINNVDLSDTSAIINEIIRCERDKKSYRISKNCKVPCKCEVEKLSKAYAGGETPERIELAWNGQEILVLEGAERYLAALRAGVPIQKWIRKRLEASLEAMDT